jgi:hypothetical protein
MKKSSLMLFVSALSLALSPSVFAAGDNSKPLATYSIAEIAGGQAFRGKVEALVRVVRITGTDAKGREQVLLEDEGSIVMRPEALADIVEHLKNRRIPEGSYRNLNVHLLDELYLVDRYGFARRDKLSDTGAPTVFRLAGTVQVDDESRVMVSEMSFDTAQLDYPLPAALNKATKQWWSTKGS